MISRRCEIEKMVEVMKVFAAGSTAALGPSQDHPRGHRLISNEQGQSESAEGEKLRSVARASMGR